MTRLAPNAKTTHVQLWEHRKFDDVFIDVNPIAAQVRTHKMYTMFPYYGVSSTVISPALDDCLLIKMHIERICKENA